MWEENQARPMIVKARRGGKTGCARTMKLIRHARNPAPSEKAVTIKAPPQWLGAGKAASDGGASVTRREDFPLARSGVVKRGRRACQLKRW